MLKELLQVSAGPFVFDYLQEPMVQLGCKPPNLRIRGLNVFDQFSKHFKQMFLRRFLQFFRLSGFCLVFLSASWPLLIYGKWCEASLFSFVFIESSSFVCFS